MKRFRETCTPSPGGLAIGLRWLPLIAWISICFPHSLLAQEDVTPVSQPDGPPANRDSMVRRHALIVVGLPGDEEHRQRFDQTTQTWQTWLTQVAGVDPQDIITLSATSPASPETSPASPETSPASPETSVASPESSPTSETLTRELARLGSRIQPDDALWVFWLGHGSRDGAQTWFHLPGPDLDATQWSALFAGIEARQQVFWLTQAGSGDFVKAMSLPGRIVIAATDASGEVNETRFPHVLATIMEQQVAAAQSLASNSTNSDAASTNTPNADDPSADQTATEASEAADSNANDSTPSAPSADQTADVQRPVSPPTLTSVLALFQATARQVLADFESESLAPTEHAQLDDNGDGVGTELAALETESLAQAGDSSVDPEASASADSLIKVDGILASRTIIAPPSNHDSTTPPSSEHTPRPSAAEEARE